MNRLLVQTICAAVSISTLSQYSVAAGISVDAGLTPPEDRWIIRTQFRYMERKDDPTSMDRKMEMYTFPLVVAYGLRPELTLLVRQPVRHRNLYILDTVNRDTGLDDLFVLAKYKLYRNNIRDYTLGIASTLGLEMPTGDDRFSSETWDLQPGLFTSWRSGPWQSDLNFAYKWNGFADKGKKGLEPGDELSVDLAFAHVFNLNEQADMSLAPVLELNYKHNSKDKLGGQGLSNTGESLLFVSPGLKFTKSSFIFEVLVQFPVWQNQNGSQLEQGTRFIVGTRMLF